jgi:putative transposase
MPNSWCCGNAVLRRQIGRVRYQPGDRLWIAALSGLVPGVGGRGLHREPGDAARPAPSAGHPQMGLHHPAASRTAIHDSLDPQARDPHGNRQLEGWGHRRVQSELVKLGHPIAASTVWQILHDAGIGPRTRRSGPTWKEFLAAQARGILAADWTPFSCGDSMP